MQGLEAWVTSASDSDKIIQCLALAKSLRVVNTKKTIVLFVNGKIFNPHTRNLAEEIFDIVVDTDIFKDEGIDEPFSTKFRMLSFPIWSKCVFIHPTCLVVRNCDDWFEDARFPECDDNVKSYDVDYSAFAFHPSESIFKTLKQHYLENSSNQHEAKAFETYLEKLPTKSLKFMPIPQTHIRSITKTETVVRFPSEIKMVKLLPENTVSSECRETFLLNASIKMFMMKREDIFCYCSVPLLSNSEEPFEKNYFSREHTTTLETNSINTHMMDNSIAIIGLSCKFPCANNADEFWDLLLQGEDVITSYPENRWQPKDQKLPNMNGGFLKCPIDEFDGNFFGISPREAEYMDPQQRMLLEISWEALENAGIDPLSLKGSSTGVFTGIWKQNYENLIMKDTNFSEDFVRSYLGNSTASSSARISYQLGLTGPNIGTDSGCSSSMVSIHLACESLRRGDSNLALAGGINLICRPVQPSQILAADGKCKTFDENANGYGRAEGCGILVLKKISEAIKDGDNIMAIIRGSGMSQEGTSSSFGTPSTDCQVLAIEKALINSRVDPLDVSYVEAHGTGTKKGDPVEVSAIEKCFTGQRDNHLVLGSVKTNIGHTESAAGVAGIIKVILSMKNKIIPAHRNLTTLNPMINLNSIPAIIPLSSMKWETVENKPRIAGINCFGISGTNVHILLQEPFEYISKSFPDKNHNLSERPQHLITLSAQTESALQQKLEEYKNHLVGNAEIKLGDFGFTANSGRAHFSHRIAITGSTVENIVDKINSESFENGGKLSKKPKIIFLFPGQGSQYPNMGKELYNTHPVFRDAMDYCDQVLQEQLGTSLLDVIWGGTVGDKCLDDSLFSQTALFCIQYSLVQLWKSFGVKPDVVLGHSLGEFAAAVAAEFMPFEDVIKTVFHRTALISNLPEGKMLAVKAGIEKVQKLIETVLQNNKDSWIDVACINSDNQVVLAGRSEILNVFSLYCKASGVKTHFLASTHAYHSRDMDVMIPQYFAMASKLKFATATCQYISGMTGSLVSASEMNANYWMDHCKYKVDFVSGARTAQELNCNVFIELGPHPVLLPLCMENAPNLDALYLPSMRKNENNWDTLLTTMSKFYVSGSDIDWNGFDSPYERKKLSLPTYPFERQKYWFESNSGGNFVSFSTTLVHPLVGRNIPLATSSVHAYQNNFDLEKLAYLVDHQIGKIIILPCSAMLEMVLAAGQIVLQGNDDILIEPLTPLVIQDLKVESPFELKEGKHCQSQILISTLQESNFSGFQITVSKQSVNEQENGTYWKRHAVGKFTPSASSLVRKIKNVDLEAIKISCECSQSGQLFYDKFPQVGLTFGHNFQSIRQIWKNPKEALGLVELNEDISNNQLEYLCHPILSDAMIQLVLFGTKDMDDLCLPVLINKFTWFSRNTKSNKYYVHAQFDLKNEENSIVYLYDERGGLLAKMEGVSVVKTTTELFLDTLSSQSVKTPTMYQEVWRSQETPSSFRAENYSSPGLLRIIENIEDLRISMRDLQDVGISFEEQMDKLCYLYISKIFSNLEWTPKVGSIVNSFEIISELNFQSCHHGLLQRFLEILSEHGIMELHSRKDLNSGSNWKVLNEFSCISEISLEIKHLHNFLMNNAKKYFCVDELELLRVCCENMASILQGKQSALPLLFPEHRDEPSAEKVYVESPSFQLGSRTIVKLIETILSDIQSSTKCSPRTAENLSLRILEIGAGTGGTSAYVFPALETSGIPYHYTFTDISTVLASQAKTKFAAYSKNAEFKCLNIDNDPLTQGFVPNQFDIILASNVLHATQDLDNTVKFSKRLLRPNGYFMVYETLSPTPYIDLIVGVLDGYWSFKDFNLRPNHTLVDGASWCELFNKNGISSAKTIETSMRKGLIIGQVENCTSQIPKTIEFSTVENHWIVVSKNQEILTTCARNFGQNERFVTQILNESVTSLSEMLSKKINEITSTNKCLEGVIYFGNHFDEPVNSEQINTNDILTLGQILISADLEVLPKFAIVTQGMVFVEDQKAKCPFESANWGLAKTLKNENPSLPLLLIDTDPDEMSSERIIEEITSEIWGNDGSDYQIAFRNSKRNVCRLNLLNAAPSIMKLPNSERYSVVLPKSRSIQDLQYTASSKKILGPNEIEVSIKATSLNFRDVMVILQPEGYYTKADVIGTDFSGVVSDVGDKVAKFKINDSVFGLTFVGALGSHVLVDENTLSLKPIHLSHAEAASLPCVFLTAMYCLENVARLKSGETLLVHAASGGIGLSAIQIAKSIGAKIIVTAGSKRKRAYLRTLGIQHVFNSRNTLYGQDIKMVTGGKGVDVVLNSLTGPNFKETTLSVCNKNVRFVEIGKVGIWQPNQVRALRPDVIYTTIDLEQIDDHVIMEMTQKMISRFESECYKPIPYARFSGTQLREALTYLQKAKHIGKIVVTTPNVEKVEDKIILKELLFNDESTYLITGGLGGIGLEVCKFMVEHGAQHLVLLNRSQPSKIAKGILDVLRLNGANIITLQCDIGVYAECEQVFKKLTSEYNLPPLRGIMHAAGVVSDGIIANQTFETFRSVFHPKVQGAWNLHCLTQNHNLEHFVLFSSVLAILNFTGQSNYAASNAFLDGLAHYRNSLGLVATSINWGAWSKVGIAIKTSMGNEGSYGVKPFPPSQGIAGLKAVMTSHNLRVAPVTLNINEYKTFFPHSKNYFEEIADISGESSQPALQRQQMDSDSFWKGIEQRVSKKDEVIGFVKTQIELLVRQILKIGDSVSIDINKNFTDMGMDSLMSVEMRNKVQLMLGKKVTLSSATISDFPTVEYLSDFITTSIYNNDNRLE